MLNSSSFYVRIDNTQHPFDHGQTAGMYVRGENEAGDNMLLGDLGSDEWSNKREGGRDCVHREGL